MSNINNNSYNDIAEHNVSDKDDVDGINNNDNYYKTTKEK